MYSFVVGLGLACNYYVQCELRFAYTAFLLYCTYCEDSEKSVITTWIVLLISQPLQDKLQWLKPQPPPKILCSHYPSLVNKAIAFISRLVVLASGLNAVAKVVKVAVQQSVTVQICQ